MAGIAPKQLKLANNGAIIYRDATGKTVELPVGANGQVLTLVGGIPTWQTPAGGGGAVDPRRIWRLSLLNRNG